jgi:stage II sporulation protein Q
MISVYQGVNDIKVKEKDKVTQGQEIATSGTSNINSELGNHLHFELYKENILVNPEDYFTNQEG